MLSYTVLPPGALTLLHQLMQADVLAQARLVGGTALALQYGHRLSVDLDFFGQIPDEGEKLRVILRQCGEVRVIKESPHIKTYIARGIKVDFVDYDPRYLWVDEPIVEDGIRLASDKDIAAMKVLAIHGRGSKKDFIDLYFILQHYTMAEVLDFYRAKYPDHSDFAALRSLAYFDDAEAQSPPRMLIPATWEEMKSHILRAVADYKGHEFR